MGEGVCRMLWHRSEMGVAVARATGSVTGCWVWWGGVWPIRRPQPAEWLGPAGSSSRCS